MGSHRSRIEADPDVRPLILVILKQHRPNHLNRQVVICFAQVARGSRILFLVVRRMDRQMESWTMLQLVIMLISITREIARRNQVIVSPVSLLWTRDDILGPNRPITADISDGFALTNLLSFDSPQLHTDDEQESQDEGGDNPPDGDDNEPPREPPRKKSRPNEMASGSRN